MQQTRSKQSHGQRLSLLHSDETGMLKRSNSEWFERAFHAFSVKLYDYNFLHPLKVHKLNIKPGEQNKMHP